MKKSKTRRVGLPYKGAPLGMYDLVMQQVRFEEQFFPHVEHTHSAEALAKELPTQKWSPAAKYAFGSNVIRFAHSLIA